MEDNPTLLKDNGTKYFDSSVLKGNETRRIILEVYSALKEKGYNPISQLVGYVLSGDPTYITNYNNARSLVTRVDRDDLLEEVFKFYLDSIKDENNA